MKQSIGNGPRSIPAMVNADEIEVLEILLQFPNLILQSEARCRFPFTWGCKRRRSAIDVSPSPATQRLSSSPTPSPLHHGTRGGGGIVIPACETASQPAVKVEASSPATPLSFSPSESDEKPNLLKKKTTMKRKREDYLKIIEELTERRNLLQGEIDHVKRYHDELEAYNMKLKARKQELSSLGPERENPCLEISLQFVHAPVNCCTSDNQHQQQQQQLQLRMPSTAHYLPLIINPTSRPSHMGESVQHASSQLTTSLASTNVLGVVNGSNMVPLGIPDLNVSVDECVALDASPALDVSVANKNLSRAMAARARQKRIQIYRIKNPIGINKPRYSYR